MLSKIVILALLLLGVWFLFFRKPLNIGSDDDENFVQCEKCSTFVEIKEAKFRRGKYICNKCLNKEKDANYWR